MKYARGSVWHKWDLHVHTPASYDWKGGFIEPKDIINQAKKEGIKVIAITDHHNVDWIDRIKIAGKEEGISVLPGFELKTDKGNKGIHIIGISYKKDVSDTRESPALEIMRILKNKGARISFSDPFTPQCVLGGETLRSIKPTERALSTKDCVVIVTDHSAYDYRMIARNSKLLFDTRNATRIIPKGKRSIIKL